MSDPYVRYVALLLELHRIAPLGKYDGCEVEAEAILSEMEKLSDGFTQGEIAALKDLSAALYIVAEGKAK